MSEESNVEENEQQGIGASNVPGASSSSNSDGNKEEASKPVSSGKRANWFRRKSKEDAIADSPKTEKEQVEDQLAERVASAKSSMERDTETAEVIPKKRKKSSLQKGVRRPRRNSWATFVEGSFSKKHAILSVTMLSLVLLNWVYMYVISYLGVSGIRMNDQILLDLIESGKAEPVGSLSTDGALVTVDGVPYGPGSYSEVFPVTGQFDRGYYERDTLSVLQPIDFFSMLKMNTQVFIWVGFTILLYFADRLYSRRNRGIAKYRDHVYLTYPLWIRIMRWLSVLFMLMAVGNWLWILL